jgi:Ca2+-binding RTX toxin-like protein
MFETLENRQMFSGDGGFSIPPGISLLNGVLRIKGADTNDAAEVSIVNNKVRADLQDGQVIHTDWGDFPVIHPPVDFNPALVQSILFYGENGHDSFTNKTLLPSTAYGGNGDDDLTGGANRDTFHGNGGDDILDGSGGPDWLYGDSGSDVLIGGSGSDYLYAKDGVDGNDIVFGDTLVGSGSPGDIDTAVIDCHMIWFQVYSDDASGVEVFGY